MVTAEHDLIRCFLADLNDVVEDIGDLYHLTDVSLEFRKLAHIIKHLNAMKEHIEREEDVIFPYLRKHGRISLCQAVQGDHINIETEIDNLVSLIVLFDEIRFEQFRTRLLITTRRLWAIMQEHLSQEDEILYPIALGIINDVKVWEKMKAVCDEIGYCGVHL
jgi:hemerythrin-like domain-containing protein